MTQRGVQNQGVELAVADDGEGTAVVLLHGLTATRRYVVMGSRALERSGHRVIAYDARGHGQSSPAPAPSEYGYPHLAADLRAVMDRLGLERAVLAGASMGAHTLLRFALESRQRLALHAHPEAVADALEAVPRSRPFGAVAELGEIEAPVTVVASADTTDPGHPQAVGEAYAAAIPRAELVLDEPGRSPLAWQGSQLSRIIAAVADRS